MISLLLACMMPIENIRLARVAERIYGWSGGILAVSIPDAGGKRVVMSIKRDGKRYVVSSAPGGDHVWGVDWKGKPVTVEQSLSGFEQVSRPFSDIYVSRTSLLTVNKDSTLLSNHDFEAIDLQGIDTRFVGLSLASGSDQSYLVISGSNVTSYGGKGAPVIFPSLRDRSGDRVNITFPWLGILDSPIGLIGLFEARAADELSALPEVVVDDEWAKSGRTVERLYLGVANLKTGVVGFRARVALPVDENAHMKPARHNLAYVADWGCIVVRTASGLAVIRVSPP